MPSPIRALVADYRKRLVHFGGLDLIEIAEAHRDSDGEAQRIQGLLLEAKRIKKSLPQPCTLIPLHASGRHVSSDQWAKVVDDWRHQAGTVCFLIGGPDGLHPELLEAAPWSLSLGSMTFPHMLTRVLLLEQLYRAFTILHRIPYHR